MLLLHVGRSGTWPPRAARACANWRAGRVRGKRPVRSATRLPPAPRSGMLEASPASTLHAPAMLRLALRPRLAIAAALVTLPVAAGAQRGAARGPYYPEPGARWERRPARAVGLDSARLAEAIAFAVSQEAKASRDLERAHYQSFGREPHGEATGPFKERGDPTGIIVRQGYIAAEWGDP